MLEAMRQVYLSPGQLWTASQRTPIHHAEGDYLPQESVGERRRFDAGQRQATYTPPTYTVPQSRRFAEGQRGPSSESGIINAAISNPATDDVLRKIMEIYMIGRYNRPHNADVVSAPPTIYRNGRRNTLPRTQ